MVPVKRPAHTIERDNLVIETTTAMYYEGKALYTRENIQSVEDQLDAYDAKLFRRRGSRPVGTLLSRCEAPQTAWVKYTDFDGTVHHQRTYMNNSFEPSTGDDGTGPVYGRPQVVFRTIQELTMQDPDAPDTHEVFANDQWLSSVAFNAMHVGFRYSTPRLVNIKTDHGSELSLEDPVTRLDAYREVIKKSEEWRALMGIVEVTHPENETLRAIDKIVYFYSKGMSDECDFCQRATYLLALATCIRELVITARQEHHKRSQLSAHESACPSQPASKSSSKSNSCKSVEPGPSQTTNGAIPIYMPASDTSRRWNPYERVILRHAGVITIPSIGKLFLKVDAHSTVISYRNENPVKQIIADLARPAMMICKPPTKRPELDFAWREDERDGETVLVPLVRSRKFDDGIMARDPDSPRVRDMLDCGDDEKQEEYEGRFVGEKRTRRKGNYLRVGDVPALPSDTAAKEALTMYVRRKGAKKEVEYWS
ncbi:hypothetical protein QBC37DRAFT_155574 [Rhypophila decipiens]|uniref:Uncharacterized protein n=1 Tax=Rhypophila decipiens TaxID=261697 RepID=A0AAN6XWW1_9PEZI|nr:hypothetical protein QBC37DRAFT_155574 [Rhypophila decipiens]